MDGMVIRYGSPIRFGDLQNDIQLPNLEVDPTEGFLTPLFDAVGDSLMGIVFLGKPGGNPAVQKGNYIVV